MIFLVVFNHIIAFQLVKVNPAVRQLWYAITVFHMPAFIFVSGFLSKSKQNVLKNIQNLLDMILLGCSNILIPLPNRGGTGLKVA